MDSVGTGRAVGRAAACRPSGGWPVGVYKPRRAQASPLFRLVADQFRTRETVYDERYAPTYGAWRAVVPEVADKFFACGVLEHGFARVQCDACAHEYLLAFSCKARYFCPSCHAKRLALWTLWLEETLLAPASHRRVVLTIPKRLRTWYLYRRTLLGDRARVAARTITAAVRTLTREPGFAVGVATLRGEPHTSTAAIEIPSPMRGAITIAATTRSISWDCISQWLEPLPLFSCRQAPRSIAG